MRGSSVRRSRSRSRSGRLWSALAVLGAGTSALVSLAAVPPASGDVLELTTYSVTANEHWGYDFVYEGQTEHFLWHEGSPGRVQAGWLDNGVLEVRAYEEGGDDPRLDFEFHPPSGEQLEVGEYTQVAVGHPFEAGRAGMHIEGTEACMQRFRIVELDRSAQRVWLLYDAHCEGRKMHLSGEIRINMPDQTPGLDVYPEAISWPPYYRGEPGEVFPVWLVNSGAGPQVLSQPRVLGAVDSFDVLDDNCGSTLPPGDRCRIRVRFTPVVSRRADAVLRVPRESGAAVAVPLDGRAYPGHTQLRVRSSQLERVGFGLDWTARPRHERLQADRGIAGFYFESPEYYGDFRVEGEAFAELEPGLYHHGDAAALDVSGPLTSAPTQCRGPIDGWFRVHEIGYDRGGLSRVRATFMQVCADRRWAPLYGAFAWRAREPAARLPSRVRLTYRAEDALGQGVRGRGRVSLERTSGPRRVKVVQAPLPGTDGTSRVLLRRILVGGEAAGFDFRWKRGWRISAVSADRTPLITATIATIGYS